ncbi:hypothetical protein [Fangia hongkongensis]|uniref:hypothetical protein n=2 Tax=Fangia hongkongensis TaxID=270495 RepID=UPI000375D74A|nr:hypothetical protein [Fangia hongkongensis]
MSMISLKLDDALEKESMVVAKSLGLSRTKFITHAIEHEIARIKRKKEREKIAKFLLQMRQNKQYQIEMEDIEKGLSDE